MSGTTSNSSRPPLGSRSVSDMHPLVTPTHDDAKRELGQGTQASSGGARVSSGGRTALGGIAPLSPFLSLPPAADVAEMQRQCSQEQSSTPKPMGNTLNVDSNGFTVRRAFSSARQGQGNTQGWRGPSNSVHMIRSYSMPVATQRDYEAQRRVAMQSKNSQASFPSHVQRQNKRSGSKENLVNAISSTKSSMGFAHLQSEQQHQAKPSKLLRSSPTTGPRLPLTPIVINEDASRVLDPDSNDGNDIDLGSGSEEAEAVTPRAASPMDSYFSKMSKNDEEHCLEDLIHPDHLQPPPPFTLS